MVNPSSALAGFKILDFSRVVAAPFATMILGDLGAEIWKVERPGVGDESRSFQPPSINGQGCYALSLNRNKKSIALNLAHAEARQLARKLARNVDVLIENFKTGYMHKFGLDYGTLRGDNPRLVYCSITGYGPDGPLAEDPGYDVVVAALGGLLGITGPKGPNAEPCKPGVAVTDMMTGLFAHGAILAALLQREKTGQGQQIHCNLLATQLATLINIGSNYLNAGLEGRPLGTEHESIVPYQAFRTKDGRHYVVGAGNDAAFRQLCAEMDMPELADSADFKTNSDRVRNREKLLAKFAEKFLLHDLEHWKGELRSKTFPSAPVNSMAEAFGHEQVKHLELVKSVEHPKYGQVKVVGPPVSYSGTQNEVRCAPPMLGEHTREILARELELPEAELERLKREKAIDF